MAKDKVVGIKDAADRDDLVGAVRSEMDASGLSQAAVAREAGVSASRLSQWLGGVYTGNVEGADSQMKTWLDARRARRVSEARLPQPPAWFDTGSAARIANALSYAQIAGDITAIYGGAGVGKTKTAQRYRDNSPSVWLATMTSTVSGVNGALERIAEVMDLQVAGRASMIEARIVERLDRSNGLLIIDEAQHLSPRALEAVRGLHDATGVGVALMGNEKVYARLTGGARSTAFAQLFSRVGKRLRLSRPTNDDVAAFTKAWGVTGADSREIIDSIARRPGALREATKTMRLACMFAGSENPSADDIRAAYADLGGE